MFFWNTQSNERVFFFRAEKSFSKLGVAWYFGVEVSWRYHRLIKRKFIYSPLHSGLYEKEYIGVEVRFPKGSKAYAPPELDGTVFDDPAWLEHYNDYWKLRRSDLEWLNDHLLTVIEFKRNDREIERLRPHCRSNHWFP
jgi:hypothetical protein